MFVNELSETAIEAASRAEACGFSETAKAFLEIAKSLTAELEETSWPQEKQTSSATE